MRITAEQQREIFDRFASAGGDLLLRETIALTAPTPRPTLYDEILGTKRPDLIAYARQRAMTAGMSEYGDATYHLTDEDLLDQAWQELADALFYLHIIAARQAGALPLEHAEYGVAT